MTGTGSGRGFLLTGFLLFLVAWMALPLGWLLFWTGISSMVVGAGYGWIGPRVLGKRPDGRIPWYAIIILFPYFAMTWTIWRLQRRLLREDPWTLVAPGVYLGRRPLQGDLPPDVEMVVDLTAEFSEIKSIRNGPFTYRCLPVLDRFAPDAHRFLTLVGELIPRPGPIYIHCALGHGRAAMVAAALLVGRGLSHNMDDALAHLKRVRPRVRLGPSQRRFLDQVEPALKALPGRAARPDQAWQEER